MDTLINVVLFGSIIIFLIISIVLFIKRYNQHKGKLQSLSQDNADSLKRDLEEELKKKKEEEEKLLKSGKKEVMIEVLERLFKSSKLAGWVKTKTYNLFDTKSISLVIHILDADQVVSTEKEITLKNGEVYTQKKHPLVIKKEYSERVFNCAYKVVEEIFNNIPTINTIYLSEYINNEEGEKPFCVLSLQVKRDTYLRVKGTKLKNINEILDLLEAKYDFEPKKNEFSEIEPINTPQGKMSLDKTMAAKASAGTVLYGNTILDSDGEHVSTKTEYKSNNKKLSNDTKISDLNGSVMLDKTILENIEGFIDNKTKETPLTEKTLIISDLNKSPDKNTFDNMLENFITKAGFEIKDENNLSEEIKVISATRPPLSSVYLIYSSKSFEPVSQTLLEDLLERMSKVDAEKGIFIANGAFSLDSVSFASKNNIELFDKEKLGKSI